jgi:hypothetical protein
MEPVASSYPITFTYDPPETVARWRPLVNWLLAIPHFILLYVLGIAAGGLALVSWVLILFTGRQPEWIVNVEALYLRYQMRVTMYVLFMQDEHPPFGVVAAATDPGDAPRVRVDVVPQLDGRNRLTTFFRYLVALPNAIVFMFVALAAAVVTLIAFFAVLFTGRWPAGMRDFVIGVERWSVRLNGYLFLLTDQYPPFSLN